MRIDELPVNSDSFGYGIPEVDAEAAYKSYCNQLRQCTLDKEEQEYIEDIHKAVRKRDFTGYYELKMAAARYFGSEPATALAVYSTFEMSKEDFAFDYASAKEMSAMLQREYPEKCALLETVNPRLAELEALDQELRELYLSCNSLLDIARVFNKRRDEVRTMLTLQEDDYLTELLGASENRDMARLDNAMIMGGRTLADGVDFQIYALAYYFMMKREVLWIAEAMKRLHKWNAGGRKDDKKPRRPHFPKTA